MSTKVVFLALLCAVTGLATAQSVNLGFSGEGDRQIWIASALPTDAPGDTIGVRTSKSEASIEIKDQPDTAQVFVWDRKNGNIASKSVKDAKAATWNVTTADFQSVAQVSVSVEHGGQPVSAATVDIDDGKHKASQLLDPSCKGVVTFFGIKTGSLKATVHYKTGGKDAPPITQLLDVSVTRSAPIPVLKISIADAVATIAPSSNTGNTTASTTGDNGGGTGSSAPTKSTPGSSGGGIGGVIGQIIIFLLTVGAIVGALYYAMIYVKKNPDSVGSKLEQLGVQIPKPGDDPLTNPSQIPAPVKPTPQPVQKIILDDSAPDPIAPISSVAVSSGIVDPRLVSQTGDAMPIPEGDLVVGREIGLGLSLVGESTVSRKHAQLSRNGNQVIVMDFGSTNGTYVNGVQLQGEKQLQSGDSVQFGSVKFRFEG